MFGRRGSEFSRRIVPGMPAAPAAPAGPQGFQAPQPPAPFPHQNGAGAPPTVAPSLFSRRVAPPQQPAAPAASAAAPPAHDIDALLRATESKLEKQAEPVQKKPGQSQQDAVLAAKVKVQPALLERIDVGAASKLPRAELERQIAD